MIRYNVIGDMEIPIKIYTQRWNNPLLLNNHVTLFPLQKLIKNGTNKTNKDMVSVFLFCYIVIDKNSQWKFSILFIDIFNIYIDV